jgi:hypothetical protein
MKEVVDELILEMAWSLVKSNRGAPSPDGITAGESPERLRERLHLIAPHGLVESKGHLDAIR